MIGAHDRLRQYQKTERHSALAGAFHFTPQRRMPHDYPHLSRRAILAGAVSVPLAAASPVVAGTADDAEVLRLAAEVMAAYDGLGDVLRVLGIADERFFQWRAAHPEPDKESAGWLEWSRCQVVSRWNAAYAAEKIASDKLYAAIDALCQAPITIRGLVEKACFVEIDEDVFGHRMVPSILDDLLALDASHV
jgi:hypothetical protein